MHAACSVLAGALRISNWFWARLFLTTIHIHVSRDTSPLTARQAEREMSILAVLFICHAFAVHGTDKYVTHSERLIEAGFTLCFVC